MTRTRSKPVNLKFDPEDVARWDAFALEHGLTRTTLVETAVEALIAGEPPDLENTPPPEPEAESPRPTVERRAFICLNPSHEKTKDRPRVFLSTGEPYRVPECPTHGQMVRVRNRPYMGEEIPTNIPEGFPQVVVDA